MSKVPAGLKGAVKLGGWVVQLAAVLFLGHVFLKNYERIGAQVTLDGALLAAGLAMVALTLASLAGVAVGWRALLRAGGPPVPLAPVAWVVGRTSIAKYLPGNVLHYVGRQVFALSLGRSQAQILATTVGEVLVVVSVAGLLGVATGAAGREVLGGAYIRVAPFALLAALAPLAALPLARLAGRVERLAFVGELARLPARTWAAAYLGYAVCVLANQLGFVAAVAALAPELPPSRLLALMAVFALAYVAGFLTPAAPGGIGVREAGIVLLGAGVADETTLAAAAVLQRLGSIAGEGLAFGLTYLRRGPG